MPPDPNHIHHIPPCAPDFALKNYRPAPVLQNFITYWGAESPVWCCLLEVWDRVVCVPEPSAWVMGWVVLGVYAVLFWFVRIKKREGGT